jgi:hypothetical protein
LGRWGGQLTYARFGKFLVMASPARRVALVVSASVEQIDGTLRQWPMAGISILALALSLGAAILVNR